MVEKITMGGVKFDEIIACMVSSLSRRGKVLNELGDFFAGKSFGLWVSGVVRYA